MDATLYEWRPFFFSEEGKERPMETKKQYAAKEGSTVKLKAPNLYNVIMLNDDFTPMDFVVEMLKTYFDKSETEATDLMLQVHRGKKAIIAKYVYDVAATKSYKVIQEARAKGYPFRVEVEKE